MFTTILHPVSTPGSSASLSKTVMATLPAHLSSVYLAYKKDNQNFARWLVNSAAGCGFDLKLLDKAADHERSESAKVPKLSGRARKLARDAEKQHAKKVTSRTIYRIAVPDYTVLATHIVKSGSRKLEISERVVKLLARLIAARKRCADWYQCVKFADRDERGNDGHQHFIEVLETTLDLLKTHVEEAGRDTSGAAPSSSTAPALTQVSQTRPFENRFAALSVEDSKDDESLTSDLPIFIIEKKKITSPVDVQVDEEEQHKKKEFVLFCLFEDIEKVREHLTGVWERHANGGIPLATAAAVTNVAIDFVRKLEEGCSIELNMTLHYPAAQEILMSKQSRRTSSTSLVSYGERNDDNLTTDQQNEIMRLADKIMLTTWKNMRKIQNARPFTDENLANSKMKFVPLSSYISALGHEMYDMQIEESFLRHVMPLMMLFVLTTETGPSQTLTMDEISHAFQSAWVRKGNMMNAEEFLKIWMIFSYRVFLDIHLILGPMAPNGLKEVEGVLSRVSKWSKADVNVFAYLRTPHMEEMRAGLAEQADNLLDSYCKAYAIEGELKIPQSQGYRQSVLCNPVLAGLISLDFATRLKEIALTTTDVNSSLLYMTHMYNALSLMVPDLKQWPDLAQIVTSHGEAYVFVGERPTNMKAVGTRLSIAFGFLLSNFGRDNPRRGGYRMRQKRRRILVRSHTPLSRLIQRRTWNFNGTEISTDDIVLVLRAACDPAVGIGKVIVDTTDTQLSQGMTLQNKTELITKTQPSSLRDTCEILTALETHLTTELPGVYFNYFALHQRIMNTFKPLVPILSSSSFDHHACRKVPTDAGLVTACCERVMILLNMLNKLPKESRGWRECQEIVRKVADSFKTMIPEHGSIGLQPVREILPA